MQSRRPVVLAVALLVVVVWLVLQRANPPAIADEPGASSGAVGASAGPTLRPGPMAVNRSRGSVPGGTGMSTDRADRPSPGPRPPANGSDALQATNAVHSSGEATLDSGPTTSIAWTQLSPVGAAPPARDRHASVFDTVNQRLIVFGGRNSADTVLNDVFQLSLGGTLTWTQVSPGGAAPPARDGHSAVYDAANQRLVISGGRNAAGRFLDDIWLLSLAGSPTWTQLSVAGILPPARDGHSAVYDAANRRLLVLGGRSAEGATLNDVWALSLAGPPAWTQLSPSGITPLARYGHAAALDSANQRVIVFGGRQADGAPLNDVWALSLAGSPTWTQLSASGIAPSARYGHAAAYDNGNRRILFFGGRDAGGGVPDAIAVLSLADTPAWSQIFPGGGPVAARIGQTAFYDALRRRIVVLGGRNAAGSAFDDVQALSLADIPSWSQLQPLSAPAAREGHAAVYDDAGQRLVVFGGRSVAGEAVNDVFALLLSGVLTSTQGSPTGTVPSARFEHSATYDEANRRMVVLGGHDAAGRALDDLWALSLSGGMTWTQLSPAGTAPSARYGHAAVYDSANRRLVVFGGRDATGAPLNDVYQLPLSGAPVWSLLQPAGVAPPARAGHTAIYDAVGQRLVVSGGRNATGAALNDLYTLSLSGAPTWSRVQPAGVAPPARDGHVAVYDAVNQRMVIYGGRDTAGELLNDVYALSLSGAPTWAQLQPGGVAPVARAAHTAVFDSRNPGMLIFGGRTTSGAILDDVWTLSLVDPAAYGVALNPSGSTRFGLPDATVGYSLRVTNTGLVSDTLALAYTGNAWTMVAPTSTGTLAPGAGTSVNVTVTIPWNAVDGATDAITLTAISQGNPARWARAYLTTTVRYPSGPAYHVEWVSQSVDPTPLRPGQQVTGTFRLKNTGWATWRKDHYPVILGTSNPLDRQSTFYTAGRWVSRNRAAFAKESQVAPGEVGTFEVVFTAPSEPGEYREYFNLVADGYAWFNDLGIYAPLTVKRSGSP